MIKDVMPTPIIGAIMNEFESLIQLLLLTGKGFLLSGYQDALRIANLQCR